MLSSKNEVPGRRRALAVAVQTAFCAGVLNSLVAHAATITVTDGGDSGTPSTCTLRQAVASANSDSAGASACVAGSGADTIVFAESVSAVTLGAGGQLSLSDSSGVSISGGASGVTIDGNNAYRVFSIPFGSKAAFDHLTIQHGLVTHADGAGIYCNGTLTITDSTITGNTAEQGQGGGISIYPQCSATLTNAIIAGNSATYEAGGIKIRGTTSILQSTISGNTAQAGGGASIAGTQATIVDTSISDNSAVIGGAVFEDSLANVSFQRVTMSGNTASFGGAGIYTRHGAMVSLTNATISGNSAGRGSALYLQGNANMLASCTVYNNAVSGEGHAQIEVADSYAPAALSNTIVASSDDVMNCSGTTIDGGGNLEDGSSCAFGGASLSNANAGLGSLADNGGFTLTHLPNPGSAAIDAIDCASVPADDQRGVERPQGSKCDIGAVEAGLTLTITDNSLFGFYGRTALYIVTLENKSATQPAADIHLSAIGSAALNNPGTMWFCTVGTCTTTPTAGPLDDTATIPAAGSLTWLISAPVYEDSTEATATMTISASGAGTTSDTDTLAIFRSTFE